MYFLLEITFQSMQFSRGLTLKFLRMIKSNQYFINIIIPKWSNVLMRK